MTQKRVLIIDDEVDLLDLLSEFFGMEDFEVLSAPNVAESVAILKNQSQKIDAVICDQNLPDGTGKDILKTCKETDHKDCFFYFSTGDINLTIEEVTAMGATGIFAKPFDIDQMVEIVSKAIELKRS